MSIPNVSTLNIRRKPRADDAIAIEPFATTGAGRVASQGKSNIYIITPGFHPQSIRDRRSHQQLEILRRSFHSLPFSGRWCEEKISHAQLRLQRLTHLGLLHHYPQLIEQNNGLVSQKEHTVIVTGDGCQVTTYGKHEG
jgi:methionyl aminopeptidase